MVAVGSVAGKEWTAVSKAQCFNNCLVKDSRDVVHGSSSEAMS